METGTLRVDEVLPKADRVGAGGKEKGDDDGHLAVASSSFSSDAAAPPSERTRSRCPLTTVPGWDLEGRLPARSCSDKTRKTANVAVDGYRIVESFSQLVEVHEEDRGARRAGGMQHGGGGQVMIAPCQKISRHTHFVVREIIRRKERL
jgi:ribosomal protein S17